VGEIVFASRRDGNWDLYSVDPDGSDLQRLTDDPADDRYPKWSPDGESILFTSTRDSNNELYLLDVSDGSLTRLTDTPIDELYPSRSPSGDQIAFTSDHDGDEDIYLMTLNQEGPITNLENYERLTENEVGDWRAVWSPDGKYIAFVSNRDGDDELYLMNINTHEEIRLSDNPGWDYDPIWSPDGSRFAFTSSREDKYLGIYTLEVTDDMQIEGIQLTPLTGARYPVEHCPVWSPDMSEIAFITDRGGNFDIFIIEPGGEDMRKLFEHHGDDMCPDWRPNQTE
jgi:TolB protein